MTGELNLCYSLLTPMIIILDLKFEKLPSINKIIIEPYFDILDELN